jgi:hypothetical protein
LHDTRDRADDEARVFYMYVVPGGLCEHEFTLARERGQVRRIIPTLAFEAVGGDRETLFIVAGGACEYDKRDAT